VSASINIRFRLKREAMPQLHQSIGPNHVRALVGPEVGNRMRGMEGTVLPSLHIGSTANEMTGAMVIRGPH
jgi:hypothetical protein